MDERPDLIDRITERLGGFDLADAKINAFLAGFVLAGLMAVLIAVVLG